MTPRILALVLLALLASNALASDYFIEPGRKFTLDGIVGPGDSMEKGEINGIDYRFFLTDASGRVGNWDIECERDKMNDHRSCTMWYSADIFTVTLSDGGKTAVMMGVEHFPRTSVTLRIDESKPLVKASPGWQGQSAASIVSRLRTSKKVTTRYQRWPYKDYIDTETNMAGFAEAFDYMKFALGKKTAKTKAK